MARKINPAGLDLIKHYEGLYLDAYLCPAGVWTIGYGHTGDVAEGDRIDKARAETLLREDVGSAEAAVERLISVDLSDNAFSALVCFTFNLGAGNLAESTLRKKLNAGDYNAVPSELARWVKSGGETLPGLVRRRAEEGELFLRPDGAAREVGAARMPQRVDAVEGTVRAQLAAHYLGDSITLSRGAVDDLGDTRYARLSQNVPDGYVVQLQRDLQALGFTAVGEPDGAFGSGTRRAVSDFQTAAGIEVDGAVGDDTRSALRHWLERGYSVGNRPGEQDYPALIADSAWSLITPRIVHFSQGDSRWADRTLGRDSIFRKSGCAVSCIAMALNHFGRVCDPGSLDRYLDANDGYAGDSVKWSVAASFPGAGARPLVYKRKSGTPRQLANALKGRLRKNRPTLARVDYGVDANLVYNHFVLVVGMTASGEFIMHDPATSAGDAYSNTQNNIIERTSRKGGYRIVQLDYFDTK